MIDLNRQDLAEREDQDRDQEQGERQVGARRGGEVANAQREYLRPRTMAPAVDIYETERSVVILADMPGVDSKRIELTVQRGTLDLVGVPAGQQPPQGELIYSEFVPARFERSFTISDAVDPEQVTATVENGVLRLELGKSDVARPRRIEVTKK